MGGTTFTARRIVAIGAAATVAVLAGGCPSLDEIPLGECGNGVIEEELGEECDAAPEAPDKRDDGAHCARAGEPNACHFVWDASTCCPPGSGAGLDGRCRTPSGTFETTSLLTIDELAVGTGAADVDGDGFNDLAIRYASREIELRFLGPAADPTPRRDVHPSNGLSRATFGRLEDPSAAETDDCGRPTSFSPGVVFIPSEEGLRVLRGRAGGGLLPKAFANFDTQVPSVPVAVPGLSCGTELDGMEDVLPPDLVCTGAFAATADGITLFTIDLGDFDREAPPARFFFEGVSIDALASPRPEAIRMPGWDGCDGLVVRFGPTGGDRANTVSVLGMCGNDEGDAEELTTFAVDEGVRVFVRDVNRDGADDLVVASKRELEVRLGDGAGAFEPAYTIANPRFDDYEQPLAIGDLDDDGAFDIVQNNALWTSGGRCSADPADCTFTLVAQLEDLELADAVIAEVTGDGRGDVVGVAYDGPLSLLMVATSGPQGVYSFDERPAAGRPRFFDVADFDGNGVEDVAFVLAAPARCTDPDAVQILYGEQGVPRDAVTVAETKGITGLAAGLILNGRGAFDGIGDMGLSTHCDGDDGPLGRNRATVLYGNQQRSIDAPYVLLEAGEQQERLIFASGHVETAQDLIAFGYSDTQEALLLWDIQVEEGGELPPNDKAFGMPTGLSDDGTAGLSAMLVADVDCPKAGGDGCASEEIVVFQSSGGAAGSSEKDVPRLSIFKTAAGPPVTTGDACGLVGSAGFADPTVSVSVAGIVSNMGAGDVDGDGFVDVIAWWYAYNNAAGGVTAGDAYVFWGGADGFGGTCPERIVPPPGEIISSIVPFPFGDATRTSVMIGTTGGAYRASFDESRALDVCATGGEACTRVVEVPGVHDASVIDYDLDGLDDLVLAVDRRIEIRRQRPMDEVQVDEEAAKKEE